MTLPSPASRALRLALTLEGLGREHGNQKLTDLAARVRSELVGRGPDLEEHYVHAVMDMAAAALAPAGGGEMSTRDQRIERRNPHCGRFAPRLCGGFQVTRLRNLSSWDAAFILAFLVLLFAAAVGYAGETEARKVKPGVPVLTVGPRLAMSGGSGAAIIHVRVEIPRPTPEMFCPRIELSVIGRPLCDARQESLGRSACDDFVEGFEAFHEVQEGDCPPWSDEEVIVVSPPPPLGDGGGWSPATRDEPFIWPYGGQKRIGMGPGEWTVRVTVTQGARRFILEGRTTVH